jgi:hypothetical protein
VSEVLNGVLDSSVLHLAVLGGPECLCALLSLKCVWTGVPKRRKCLLRAIALGVNVLVMTNELHLKVLLIMSLLNLWDSSSI